MWTLHDGISYDGAFPHFSLIVFAMAEFDSEVLHDQNAQLTQEYIQLRNSFHTQTQEITYLRNMVQQPANSAPPTQKSLNLPLPPRFSGSPSELNSFKLRLI